jgi:hypothetical protein
MQRKATSESTFPGNIRNTTSYGNSNHINAVLGLYNATLFSYVLKRIHIAGMNSTTYTFA